MKPLTNPFLVAGMLLLLALLPTQTALAQDDPGRIGLEVNLDAQAEPPVIVMVSAILDGEIVNQKEALLSSSRTNVVLWPIPPGLYDVRIEGEGVITEVKRGLHVFAGRDANLVGYVRPGEGVHVVEYAIGGLAREEVAVRLRQLETNEAELRAQLVALQESQEEQ